MSEHYRGGNHGTRQYSPKQLKQMKENMKKVPNIQKKAEQYQKKEEAKAEQELEHYLNAT